MMRVFGSCGDVLLRSPFKREPAMRHCFEGRFLWDLPQLWNPLSTTQMAPPWLSSGGQGPVISSLSAIFAPKHATQSSLLFLSCRVSDLHHCLKTFPTYSCPLSSFSFTGLTSSKSPGLLTLSRHLLPGVHNKPTVQRCLFFSEVHPRTSHWRAFPLAFVSLFLWMKASISEALVILM